MASLPAPWRSSRAWASPPTSADAEEQVLGRDVLVAEPAGLVLGPLDDALGARVEGSASRPRSGRAWRGSRRARRGTPGRSTPSRRRVSAGMPSSGSTSASRRCSASRTGLCRRCGGGLGGDDGLLGLLGEAVELHGRSLGRCGSARGSGWSTRSTKRPRRPSLASSDRSVGRTTRALTYRSPWPVALKPGHPLAVSRNVRPFWVPAGILRRTRPLSVSTGTSAPSRASPRVSGSSRSRSAPRRREAWRRAGTCTTTYRSPPPGAAAGQPDPGAGVGARAGS